MFSLSLYVYSLFCIIMRLRKSPFQDTSVPSTPHPFCINIHIYCIFMQFWAATFVYENQSFYSFPHSLCFTFSKILLSAFPPYSFLLVIHLFIELLLFILLVLYFSFSLALIVHCMSEWLHLCVFAQFVIISVLVCSLWLFCTMLVSVYLFICFARVFLAIEQACILTSLFCLLLFIQLPNRNT